MVYFIAVDLREWGTTKKCLHKTRNEIYPKCRFTMKKILFTLLFIASKMKYNFISWVVGANRSIKKCKQARARY